jgi:ribosome maturation factor RimP
LFFCQETRDSVKNRRKPSGGKQSEKNIRQAPSVNWKAFADQVTQWATPICEEQGIELVYVEYQPEEGGRTLRLYIDKPGGVKLDDCVSVSRQLGDVLDVKTDDAAAYNLEVSSPGPERPIGKAADYERFRMQQVRIRTIRAVDGRKKFTGVLLGLENACVRLRVDDSDVEIPLELVKKAQLVNYQGES